MQPSFPFTNGYKVEGGNIFGHIRLTEVLRIANPVEICIKLEFDKWGDWIELFPLAVRSDITFYQAYWGPEPANPPLATGFHPADIDLGRKAHPILYINNKQREFFQRFNKLLNGPHG